MRDVLLKILTAVEALAPAPTSDSSSDSKETETKQEPDETVPETTKKRSVSK